MKTFFTKTQGPDRTVDDALRLESARRFAREDRLADAEALYAELCERRPGDATLWIEAGRVAESLGYGTLAAHRFKRAATVTDKRRGEALHLLAVTHLRNGEIGQAARAWHRLLNDSTNTSAWAGLLVCAVIEDRPRLGRRSLRELRLHASRRERRRMVAQLWLDAAPTMALREAVPVASPLQTLLAKAAHSLAAAAERYPLRADVHHHHAVCAARLGQVDDAIAANDRALRINHVYTDATRLKLRLARLRQAA